MRMKITILIWVFSSVISKNGYIVYEVIDTFIYIVRAGESHQISESYSESERRIHKDVTSIKDGRKGLGRASSSSQFLVLAVWLY